MSVLSGKIMFRDVYLITENYSIRIQLGLAIFRWWRPLTRKKINEGQDIVTEATFCPFDDNIVWFIQSNITAYGEKMAKESNISSKCICY